ncbi:MAG TPA: LysR family transcriptional regulator [Candidatus Limnocylindria bacterium]|jgi:DNA-binding transcriptional LysR family regulator|nr:LysR family transcriptional regulator [Candidatus Limnocylindria bacterium]
MELRHLRHFVAVAEEMHFARAAERLGIAQPPLSQSIRNLEAELGVALFDRSTRPVALTEAGRTLLKEARPILAQAEYALDATRFAGLGSSARLEVGTIGSATFSLLPRLLAAYVAERPDVNLTVTELSSPQQIAALRDGRIHVGLLRPPIDDERIATRTILREPFLVALPPAHRLAAAPRIDLASLRDEPFVFLARTDAPGLYDEMIAMARAAGFRPRIRQHANQFQTIVALVAAGLGVAIVPASMARVTIDGGVVYREIIDETAVAEIAVAWRTNDTAPEVGAFITIAARCGLRHDSV